MTRYVTWKILQGTFTSSGGWRGAVTVEVWKILQVTFRHVGGGDGVVTGPSGYVQGSAGDHAHA